MARCSILLAAALLAVVLCAGPCLGQGTRQHDPDTMAGRRALAQGDANAVGHQPCPSSCSPFQGCYTLCLCAGPAYTANGKVWGNATIINRSEVGAARVDRTWVDLYDNLVDFVMTGPTSLPAPSWVAQEDQVSFSFTLTPGYDSNYFTPVINAQAYCTSPYQATADGGAQEPTTAGTGSVQVTAQASEQAAEEPAQP